MRVSCIGSSDVQANGHHEVDEGPRALAIHGRLDQPRPQRADELQDELVRLRALQALAQEVRVETDLERLAVEWERQRLARLPDVRCLSRDLERALAKAQAQRRVLLREQANPAHDLEK